MRQFIFVFVLVFFNSCSSGPFDINKKGGMVYTLQCDVVDFLVAESKHTNSPDFSKALKAAENDYRETAKGFIDVFLKKYEEINPGESLVNTFVLAQPKHYKQGMTTEQLKNKLFERFSYSIDQALKILSNRFDHFGVPESDRRIYKNKDECIVIEIAEGFEKNRIRRLMQVSANLGFFETWENEETYRYLSRLNEMLGADSALTTQLFDSNEKNNPLFSHLKPAFEQDERKDLKIERGCRIGTTLVRDTAFVNRLLCHNITHSLLPPNMHLFWAAKPEGRNKMESYISLYAVKAESIYYPALDGTSIVSANVERDTYNKDRIIVSIEMDANGALEWERLTGANAGKHIAIVLDEHVYTAPRVEGKIAGGKSSIQGNFTMEEAEDLTHVLRSGALPARIVIIEERAVPRQK